MQMCGCMVLFLWSSRLARHHPTIQENSNDCVKSVITETSNNTSNTIICLNEMSTA